jgi:hypothetical protein
MSSERNINRDNYEEYFLDWLDGNLDGSLLPMFLQFLEENPDLAVQLREMEQVTLSPGPAPLPADKASLKKKILTHEGISGSNYEEKMVASLEGELSTSGQRALEEFVALNPALQYDLDLYRKTRLEPDMQVTYPGKEKLKRRPAVYLNLRRVAVSSAAAVLLALMLWKVFTPVPEVEIYTPAITAVQQPTAPAPKETRAPAERIAGKEILPVSGTRLNNAAEAMASVNVRPEPLTAKPIAINGIVLRKRIPSFIPGHEAMETAQLPAFGQEPEKQNLLGKILKNFGENASEKRDILKEALKENAPDGSFNFWELADLGIRSFSKMTDRDLALSVVKDETGSPMEYSLKEDDRILLTRPINQP